MRKILKSSNLIKDILWRGRHHQDESGVSFYYTASGFDISFRGSLLIITVDASYEDACKKPYLLVLITSKNQIIENEYVLSQGTNKIEIISGQEEIYKVQVYKRTEALMSKTKLTSLELEGDIIVTHEEYPLSIEFIGDSLTCGYGNLSDDVDKPFTTDDEDGMKSFASIAASKLKAYYEIVAVSGIGIYKSIYASVTLPRIYEFRDIHDRAIYHQKKTFDWIVMMLGTNDNSYMKFLMDNTLIHEQEAFLSHYKAFLQHIRKLHPASHILCLTEVERQNHVHDLIRQAVDQSQDAKCYHLELPKILESEGMGAQYHPTLKTHERWGQIVAQYIEVIHEKIHP
jgi:lysophospholipase L1-like esterase